MNEAMILPLIILMGICVPVALYASLRRQYVVAHLTNLIPLALISASVLFAVIGHTAGKVTPGGLSLLVVFVFLVVPGAVAAARSMRWAVLFWLT